jgi:hypothetical protein
MIVNQFFYDNQIRRFVLQFVRVFSNFQVEFGQQEDGTRTLQRVPVRFAGSSRQAAMVLRDNSASSLPSTPMISVYITNFTYDRPRIMEPNFVDKIHIREREYDADQGRYTHRQGNAYTIERLMPVPYQLEMRADIWTSNLDQKLQILEQLAVMFNPTLEIQSTDNYVDWTSLSYIELTGSTFSTNAMPMGLDDSIEVSTLTFTMPIWISAPAKVKQLGVIQRVISGVYDYQGELEGDVFGGKTLTRNSYTPLDYGVVLLDGEITIMRASGTVDQPKLDSGEVNIRGTPALWNDVINLYGALSDGVSQIRLFNDDGDMIVGTVSRHPTLETVLLFNVDVDTIPSNTLEPVDAIINPIKVGPNSGLVAPAQGTRYLLTRGVGDVINDDGADAWKGLDGQDLIAGANDIIEYDGTQWRVVFAAAASPGPEYMTNIKTGIQYRWNGTSWQRSYEGRYRGGSWSLVL